MKKFLLPGLLVGAAFLAIPASSQAGFSINFGTGGYYGGYGGYGGCGYYGRPRYYAPRYYPRRVYYAPSPRRAYSRPAARTYRANNYNGRRTYYGSKCR